jgi:tRNA 2-selenouridine synthase
MIHTINIANFLSLDSNTPLLDVRTPAEFAHGHIPGAYNLPLFSNEERVVVGTTYKQQGREQAILLGFDLTGPKWSGFIRDALQLSPQKKVAVHCWRGGMRSGAMAWALNLYGFEVYLLAGGYKSYRRDVLTTFEKPYHLLILGGMTGSGKTLLLHELKKEGEQIIDLEHLAQHQGSSYGSMGVMVQPTQEQFENNLAKQLNQIENGKVIWVEDESISVGKLYIPKPFWDQMLKASMLNITVPVEQRVDFLVKEYGSLNKNFLIESTERIRKRLGPEQTKNAVKAIEENRMADFIRIVLVYYDKTYFACLNKRGKDYVQNIDITSTTIAGKAAELLLHSQRLNLEINEK